MTDLIACLSTGKGTWSPVIKLINSDKFDNVYLITNKFGKENFQGPDKVEMIVLDGYNPVEEMRDTIVNELKEKIEGTEVALNMISGSGNEHMALLSAVIKMGVGFRLVLPDDEGFSEL